MQRPILFFRQGSFSHINDRVAGWLSHHFPECELVQIDVLQEVIKPANSVFWQAAALALPAYVKRSLSGERDFRDCFYRTPFLFHAVRRLIAGKFAPLTSSALFSIQTQSLYDAGIDGLPHFVYTDHTHLANLRYPGADRSRLFSPEWIKLEAEIYRRARRNLVMSGFIRDSLLQDYSCDPARVEVVGAAPNLNELATSPEPPGEVNATILFLGIGWERKGGPLLIDAFKRVVEKIPSARLIIAGSSPAIDLPNVEVLGRVPLEEVNSLLRRCSVFAFPSLREPQGIAAIEALMHGIPVVASAIGALPEVVEDGKTGRIVPPGDPVALASALIDLLSDPDLCRRYGLAARESFASRFSSPVVSGRFAAAIRSAL